MEKGSEGRSRRENEKEAGFSGGSEGGFWVVPANAGDTGLKGGTRSICVSSVLSRVLFQIDDSGLHNSFPGLGSRRSLNPSFEEISLP